MSDTDPAGPEDIDEEYVDDDPDPYANCTCAWCGGED